MSRMIFPANKLIYEKCLPEQGGKFKGKKNKMNRSIKKTHLGAIKTLRTFLYSAIGFDCGLSVFYDSTIYHIRDKNEKRVALYKTPEEVDAFICGWESQDK